MPGTYNLGAASWSFLGMGYDKAMRQTSAIGRALHGLTSPINQFRASLLSAFNPMRALVGIVGAIGLGSGINGLVALARQAEDTQAAFEVFLSSATKAKSFIQDIRKFAIETPLQEQEIKASSRLLLGLGAEAKSIIPTMRMLGDVSSGIQRPLNDIAYIYGTLIKQGRVYTIDIRQFALRGIPIVEALAKVFKTTEQNVHQMVTKGKVNFQHIEAAFKIMTSAGGKYSGIMEKMSRTLTGRWSTFKDAVQVGVLIPLGEAIVEIFKLKEGLEIAIKYAENFSKTFEPRLQATKKWIDKNWDSIVKFGKALLAIGAFVVGFLAIAKVAALVSAILVGWPIALVVGGVMALVYWFAKLRNQGITEFLISLGAGMLEFVTTTTGVLTELYNNWTLAWDDIVGYLENKLENACISIENFAKRTGQVIRNLMSDVGIGSGGGSVNLKQPKEYKSKFFSGLIDRNTKAKEPDTKTGGSGGKTWDRWQRMFKNEALTSTMFGATRQPTWMQADSRLPRSGIFPGDNAGVAGATGPRGTPGPIGGGRSPEFLLWDQERRYAARRKMLGQKEREDQQREDRRLMYQGTVGQPLEQSRAAWHSQQLQQTRSEEIRASRDKAQMRLSLAQNRDGGLSNRIPAPGRKPIYAFGQELSGTVEMLQKYNDSISRASLAKSDFGAPGVGGFVGMLAPEIGKGIKEALGPSLAFKPKEGYSLTRGQKDRLPSGWTNTVRYGQEKAPHKTSLETGTPWGDSQAWLAAKGATPPTAKPAWGPSPTGKAAPKQISGEMAAQGLAKHLQNLKLKTEDAASTFDTFLGLAHLGYVSVFPNMGKSLEAFGEVLEKNGSGLWTMTTNAREMQQSASGLATSFKRLGRDGKVSWGEFNALTKKSPGLLKATAESMGLTEDKLKEQLKTRKGIEVKDLWKGMQKQAEPIAKRLEDARRKSEALRTETGPSGNIARRELSLMERQAKVTARAKEGRKGKTGKEGDWAFAGISDVQTGLSTLGNLGAKMQGAAKTKEDKMMESQQGLTTAVNGLAGKIPAAGAKGLPVDIKQSVPIQTDAVVGAG